MIPRFPHFRALVLEDRAAVEDRTRGLPPYSDWNFTSLWCWNTAEHVQVSILNDNLVVRFADYVTSDIFYSFLGSTDADNTAARLLAQADAEGLTPHLKLITEESARSLSRDRYMLSEDRDNFDYVISVGTTSTLAGRDLHHRRDDARRFLRDHAVSITDIDLTHEANREAVLNFFQVWAQQKSAPQDETHHEWLALSRILDAAHALPLIGIGLWHKSALLGFAIAELLDEGFAMLHFEKADRTKRGSYAYLRQQLALWLRDHGGRFLNYQQDLGILGLRTAKLSFAPCVMLKKYRVAPLVQPLPLLDGLHVTRTGPAAESVVPLPARARS